MFRKILLALVIAVAFAGAACAAQTVPGDVIVVFNNNSDSQVSASTLKTSGVHFKQASYAAAQLGSSVKHVYSAISQVEDGIVALIHAENKDENELLKEVLARSDVKAARLNYIAKPFAAPNDKYYDLLWGMKAIKADKVWDKNLTGSDAVYVAVIDSGLYNMHEDLAANIDTARSFGVNLSTGNIIKGSSGFSDKSKGDIGYGHGTHTSGTIGAVGNNSIGVTGVNWNVKIIMANAYNKIGKEWGFADSATIAALNEIVRLKQSGVNIAALNMSLGGYTKYTPSSVSNSRDPYWAALKAVSDAGIIISVSAGNEDTRVGYPTPYNDPYGEFSKGQYVYPASYLNIDNMIVVAAASQDAAGNIIRSSSAFSYGLEAGSNYGDKVDITAPGAAIVSTTPYDYTFLDASEVVEYGVNNYASWPGTSMAAPHVAGAAALLKSAYPDASAKQIKQAILDGANSSYCANDASDTRYYMYNEQVPAVTSKYGFLDVENALTKLAAALGRTVPETPAEETPVEETPVEETPVEETPAEETPVEETPVDEKPVTDTPVDETPVDDKPVDDTPVNDKPVDDTPVNDNTGSSTGETLQSDIRPSWASDMSITEFYSLLFSGSRTFKSVTPTDAKSSYDANNPVKLKLSSPLTNDTRIYVRMMPSAYNGSVSAADAETVNAVMLASGDVIEVRPGKLYNPYKTSQLVEIDGGRYDIKLTTAGSSAGDSNAIALSANNLYFSEYDPYDDDGYYDYDDDDYYDYDDDDYRHRGTSRSSGGSSGCSSLSFGLLSALLIAAGALNLNTKRRA